MAQVANLCGVGSEMVEHGCEGVDVGAVVVGLLPLHFATHVSSGATVGDGVSGVFAEEASTEVNQLDGTISHT